MSATALATAGNAALGAVAVSAANGTYGVFLVNAIRGEVLSVLGTHFGYVYKVQFSPCGRLLASCGADGVVQLFQIGGFSFYKMHFWADLELHGVAAARAELQTQFNQKEPDRAGVYGRYKRFEELCVGSPDLKMGSI